MYTWLRTWISAVNFSTFVVNELFDKLIDVGFIDVAVQGGSSLPSKYAISDRWMKYGTDEYKEKHRKRLPNQKIGIETRFKSAQNKNHPEKSNKPCTG